MLTSRGLGTVLGDLAEMGYDARWCVLGACDAGAPHKRERIWILADANIERGCRWETRRQDAMDVDTSSQIGMQDASRISWWDIDPADLPDAQMLHAQGCVDGSWEVESVGSNQRERGDDENGPAFARLGRVAHGVAHRVDRLKAIGNGQVSAVVRLAWNTLMEGVE